MVVSHASPGAPRFLPRAALADLVTLLQDEGFTVVGPTVVDGVVMYRPIDSPDDLPHGVNDVQQRGTYRLAEGDPELTFEFASGPDSPKRFLFPPQQQLMQFRVQGEGFEVTAGPPDVPKIALLGVRPCDLAAIRVQDRVFGQDDPATFRCESEPWYEQAREQTLLVAVNCTSPGGNCFCVSWGTGPEAHEGFDLSLTELRDGFICRAGSPRGKELAAKLPLREPTRTELDLAELLMNRACEHMGRALDTASVKELLEQKREDSHWDEVAQRCLSCGNCTMVCPTCFCSTVTDVTDLSGEETTRVRSWESCFTHQFSYTVAGPGRDSLRSRYRHWLRHKLCTWQDQFGVSGCVGCGRCITWCPVGIDITQEVQALRNDSTSLPAPIAPACAFSSEGSPP
ncbi:MAG: sulfite reductase subunit A [Planctomycetaceae bacterium]|nr:sulfite reductase subunit A [Planctomycetaceae bacterium]